MNRLKKLITSGAAAAALVGAVAIAAPANAVPVASEQSTPVTLNAALKFAGFDPARAAANGYEVRTDSQGWQYAVPIGTPADSTAGATPKFNPATGETEAAPSTGGVSPMNTETFNCGSATLTLYSATSGYTAYNLNGLYGGSVYHTWKIQLSASTGSQTVDRSGFPPFPGALNWGTNFSYNVHTSGHGTVLITGVINPGIVETTLGECTATGVYDQLWS